MTTLFIALLALMAMGLVVRHDIPDERFIALGKKYPQIGHLADGEATLVSKNWLLSAAHVAIVLHKELENGITPRVQIDNREYDVGKVVLHPNFYLDNTSIKNDIALIQIKGNITHIPVAQLYEGQDELGKQITIVGRGDFGNGVTGPRKADKITRAATNRIDKVQTQWLTFVFDHPASKNSTELEGVSGPGDSGGPAFLDIDGVRYIVGVSSNQRNNGQEGVYGVTEYYARVSYYKHWIEDQMD